MTAQTTDLFYFAGRPVAQWRHGSAGEWLYLTTDHLGTPLLATDTSGGRVWEDGLDPFGEPYLFPCGQVPREDEDSKEGSGSRTPSKAMEEAGIFLRFPGQWDDSSFGALGIEGGVYYNVHRWYEPATGRYQAKDPIQRWSTSSYVYSLANPLLWKDPLGLVPVSEYGRRNDEVMKLCRRPSALGCAGLTYELRCRCECSGNEWVMRLEAIVQDIKVYYSTDCETPATEILRHERDHVPDLQDKAKNLKEFARKKSGKRWASEQACLTACQIAKTKAATAMLPSILGEIWHKLRYPARPCRKR